LVSNHDGGKPRGSNNSQDGDGCLGDGSGDNDDSDGDANQVTATDASATNPTTTATQQKRKKPKKKMAKKKALKQQSSPPRVPLTDLFLTGAYPEGESQDYSTTCNSFAESRYDERLLNWKDETWLSNYRKAAEVHRETRLWLQESVKPGQSLHEVAEGIEDSVRALLGNAGLETGDGLKSGLGFPTGLCLNHQVAHYTPNPGQKEVILQSSDLLTVDFGVHINGWIVDSAFTIAFEPTYDALLEAVKDATNSGIRAAGIDVRISDVSAAIQEAMESHEVELNGKVYPVKPVRNLSAHNIAHYHIHGGKSIPFVKNNDQTKMEEGEVFAIETFGSTGRGSIVDDVSQALRLTSIANHHLASTAIAPHPH
jgi:methionyl aminopeptidase